MSNDDGDRPATEQGDEQQAVAPGPTTPSGERSSQEQPPAETRRRRPAPAVIAGLVAVVVALAVLTVVLGSGGSAGTTTTGTGATAAAQQQPAGQQQDVTEPVVAPRPVSAEQLAALPQATTFGETPNTPRDPAPEQVPGGRVAHPTSTVAVFAAPGGEPVAAVPAQQPIGIAPHQTTSDTWLPVLEQRPGWALVGLPSRPTGSVAWLHLDPAVVELRASPYLITVDRAGFELTLHRDGTQVGRWKVGIGRPDSPTPAGRTFLLAAVREAKPTFSPIVLPLGTHSQTHTTYGGGPGTVGVHTWPSADVYGKASSDGCVRVPADALQVLTEVPLGTPVLIK